MPRRILLAVSVTAIACLTIPAAASAYQLGGRPWPQPAITYFVAAKSYSNAVGRAARIWNRAAVGTTFRRAPRADADVIVVYGGGRCDGESPMGYGGRREMTFVQLGAGCSQRFITLTAVHELGHVLGLDHESSRCARMNPSFSVVGTPIRCRPHGLAYWVRHALSSDDVRGARALYRFVEFERNHWDD